MKTITCKQLRQMIAAVLNISIDDIRAIKDNQFFYEFDIPPTDDEIDEFIISSNCFDDEMKEWLVNDSNDTILIRNNNLSLSKV